MEECTVKETAYGGYIFLISAYNPILLLINISSEGDLLWAKDFVSAYGPVVGLLNAGENFIIFMSVWDPDLGEEVKLNVEIDTNGNVIWAKTFFINGEKASMTMEKFEENGNMVFRGGGAGVTAYIKFSPSFVPIFQRYYEAEPNNWWPNCTTTSKYDEEGNLLWAREIEPFWGIPKEMPGDI